MSKRTYVLHTPLIRENACRAIIKAEPGYVVTIAEPTRSSAQNSRMWAMLTDIADAQPEGRQWTPETWKSAFLHYLGHQVRFCEGLMGTGPFPMGFHSSRLSVREMADLITCIQQYGDEHGVKWSHGEEIAA